MEAPGFEVFHTKVVVKQAETARVVADLQRVGYGYLVVDANAGEVEIEVDDRPYPTYLASGAPIKIKLNAGKHKLYLDADGRKTYEGEVEVPRGREQPVHGRLTNSYPRGKAVVMGVLAAGLGVGGLFMHLEAKKPVGMPHNEDIHQVFSIGRYVAWGGAGLFAGLSIFYAVYDPNPDPVLKEDDKHDFPDTEDRDAGPTDYDAGKVKRETSGIFHPYLLPYGGPDSGGLVVGGAF
ncbi:MAG TPA: hypothetical protein ENK23_04120 [Sorangium sp.]|nr:hypothetical protein [Sorangium sp.]